MRFFDTYVKSKRAEEHLARWVTAIMAIIHGSLGTSIIVGGIKRFSVPTYQPLIEISGGEIWIWGLAILASSALMLAPFRRLNLIGLWIGMAWMLMWTTMFFVAVITYPDAAATPMVAYGGFAMINMALLTARLSEDPPRRMV